MVSEFNSYNASGTQIDSVHWAAHSGYTSITLLLLAAFQLKSCPLLQNNNKCEYKNTLLIWLQYINSITQSYRNNNKIKSKVSTTSDTFANCWKCLRSKFPHITALGYQQNKSHKII